MALKFGPENLQSRIVSKHFRKVSEDPIDRYYQCLISSDCIKPLSGKKLSNLTSHAKTHKIWYQENYGMDTRERMGMAATRLQFIQQCTELVTVNSEPFELLGKSGFLKMNKEKLQQLKDAGQNSGLAAPGYVAVKQYIKQLAGQIRDEIRSEISGKFCSLMVDGATKAHRSVLGLYVQYMDDCCVVRRSLGMINLTSSHTGAYLADVVRERLRLVGIKTANVISVTTDNAANMTSMIGHLNRACDEDNDVVESSAESTSDSRSENYMPELTLPVFDFSSGVDYEAIFEKVINEIKIEDLCNAKEMDDVSDINLVLEEMQQIIATETLNIHSVRCAAHTLQLAVVSALGIAEFENIILLCRAVAKELRKNSAEIELGERAISFKIPHIDVKTRWNSTYIMVRNILIFYLICNGVSEY